MRPSGTEPKVKCYIEVSKQPTTDVSASGAAAESELREIEAAVTGLLAPA